MNNVKCVLLSFLSILVIACYSQGFELKYEFSDSVNCAILRGIKKGGTDSVYVQFFRRRGDLNVISVRSYRLYNRELLEAVLSSLRSVDVAGKKMPIIFNEDMMFEKHLCKYSLYGNSYIIKFTDDGKIREEYEDQ